MDFAGLFFPRKCTLCRALLAKEETDFCHSCRKAAPEFIKAKRNIPFVANWTAVWYYKDTVRRSLLRFKFYNFRGYADVYARVLAMRILTDMPKGYDILAWVPTGFFRRLRRGYDHAQLLAVAVARELGTEPAAVLKKVRNTPPLSRIRDAAHRRAMILGAYRVIDPAAIAGKRILVIDDIITTGATSSECAKTLLTAGAKEVYFAAVAAAVHDNKGDM